VEPRAASVLLRDVRPYGQDRTDVLLDGGVIASIGAGLAGEEVVDGEGAVLLPGLVDLHTHLREPGREDAETVHTGSAAAALGGYTAVFAMPNTDPAADTAGVVEQVWRLGHETGLVDVVPVGAVTVGRAGRQLAELGAMADSAVGVRVFSDDGSCVADPALMRRALEYVRAFDGVIAQHAEEPRLTAGAQLNEGVVSARLGLTGWPAAAEEAIIARDALLTGHVGSRLHVCHVSAAGSVEIIRWAKSKGWRVTAEVTPHHLVLTDDLASSYDPVFKVNPPLRTAADVEALRAGLADGTIDCVATDHAPHSAEDKETEWGAAAPGMLGLQTALSVVIETMVEPGRLDWRGVAARMSEVPARIGGLDGHGRPIAVGEPANLVLVDPSARWTVDPSALASRSRNTPFAGRTLPGRVRATFLRGRATVRNGELVPPSRTGQGVAYDRPGDQERVGVPV
jgi:dihydroorotase